MKPPFHLRTLFTLCATITAFQVPAEGQIDLHAHLIMKPGMGPFIQGSFEDEPQATEVSSRLKTKASRKSLDSFLAPQLIVVSLYAHPFLSHLFRFDQEQNVRDALEQEYQILETYVHQHENKWVIARNAQEARSALASKKRIFVLSVEGAFGAFENEDDYKKWIDERGVAIVTPFHLTEDHFGGMAFMPNLVALVNGPLSFLQSVLITGGSCLGTFCKSPVGVKPDGGILIQNLLKRKVWIDFAHANEMEIREIIPELRARKLPLLVTHTQLREMFPAERGLGKLEVDYLAEMGGMVGLIPSGDLLPDPLPGSQDTCESGLERFKQGFRFAASKLGAKNVAMGSDINAPLTGLSRPCTTPKGQVLDGLQTHGFYTYSQWNELAEYIAPDTEWSEQSLEQFLKLWERVRE